MAFLRQPDGTSLRHTFGSLAITRGSTVDVQAWLGHADARTTSRYTHYRARGDEARLLADAFRLEEPEPEDVAIEPA
jgi:integrase